MSDTNNVNPKTLSAKICLRKDSKNNWQTTAGGNVVLLNGELAIELDNSINPPTVRYKIGDGTTKFSNLPYISYSSLSIGNTDRSHISNGSLENGIYTKADGLNSHAEGVGTNSQAESSHSEGITTHAAGQGSHTEGAETETNALASHTEGSRTKTTSNGIAGHAEGIGTQVAAPGAHSEGFGLDIDENTHLGTSGGFFSHTEGLGTTTQGLASHTGGVNAHDGSTNNAGSYVWQGFHGTVPTNQQLAYYFNNPTDPATKAFFATVLTNNPQYVAHGQGTWNINPVGGTEGFYIGNQNLKQILDSRFLQCLAGQSFNLYNMADLIRLCAIVGQLLGADITIPDEVKNGIMVAKEHNINPTDNTTYGNLETVAGLSDTDTLSELL